MTRDPAVVSYTMSHIRGKDTGIEKKLRKGLTEAGIVYRTYCRNIFGHPDIAIAKYKIAIFADSEFWHGYRFEENASKIHSHEDYWIPKIRRNMERDQEVNAELRKEGYLVLRFWGNEIEKDFPRVMKEILSAIEQRKHLHALRESIQTKTTLVYVEKGDSYLMLHRVKKNQDPNEGKWIGVGGHVEPRESIVGCMKREVKEETGLDVLSYEYKGSIDFLNDSYPPERMFLFKVTDFSGDLIECDEGDLAWVKKEAIPSLNLWEGDRAFLPLLENPPGKPFSMSLLYRGGNLSEVVGPCYPAKKQTLKKRKKAKKKNKK